MPNPTTVGIARIVCAREGKFSKGCEWRGAIGPWEQMFLHVHPNNDGTYAILSPDGSEWFSFDEVTGGWGWRPNEPGQPGSWEKFDRDLSRPSRIVSQHDPSVDFVVLGEFPATAPPVPVLTVPKLWIEGRDWQDDDRLYVPRWCGMLSALRPDRSRDQWEEYLAWAIGAGFTGARVFAGALTWANQTAEAARQRLPEFLDVLAAHGFACEVTACTDSASGYDWRHHLRAVMDICRGREGVVVEGANEIGHGTQAEDLTIENIREVIQDPAFVALTVACGAVFTDEPDATGRYPGYGGDYCTVHLDRGRDYWNQCRRVRELYACVEAEGVPCLDNEPLGAAELDGEDTGKQRCNDPPFFACLGALDRAFQGVGGIHHSDAGVDVLLPGPVQTACAAAYVAAHLAVERCLPGVVGGYYNAGHTNSPVGYYTEAQWAHEIVRHYSFCHGGRGASVVIGLANPNLHLNWQNGWAPTAPAPVVEYARAADGSKLQVWEIVQTGARSHRR